MSRLRTAIDTHKILLLTGVMASLTLGLAPFVPHPHIYKQLRNLARGELSAPLDIFDLFLHGVPWLVLVFALARVAATAYRSGGGTRVP